MRNPVRISTFVLALTGAVAAHGAVVLSFGTPGGVPLTALTIPATGTTTLSVFYTSTTALSAGEVFTAYDRSNTAGTSATKLDGLVSLTSPSAATGVSLSGIVAAGGANSTVAPSGTARSYGLDIQGVTASSGFLPLTGLPTKLFDVTLSNLALAAGGSYTLSFYTATSNLYTSQFFDTTSPTPVAQTVTGTSLTVSVAPVPEPSAFAVLGLGAVAVLRRRKRA